MAPRAAGSVLSTILRHDDKRTSYKIALLRAINDVALAFPDAGHDGRDVAVPLRMLAEFWVAYYWPFVDPAGPVLQGRRFQRARGLTNDIAFRPELTALRQAWESLVGDGGSPADGFFLIGELRVPRRRDALPPAIWGLYGAALQAISGALEQPIRYAGPGEWSIFTPPAHYLAIGERAAPLPGTGPRDRCLVIHADLWATFREMSLWVEALCLHEWALFTERIQPEADRTLDRGAAYVLLTDRPDNRRPLTWERNHIDLLIIEGRTFVCPWTERAIATPGAYAVDHLVPVSVYPINELWNLVPADARFNAHDKRDRLPSPERLARATPLLAQAYTHYDTSRELGPSLRQDVAARFAAVPAGVDFPNGVAHAVAAFIAQVDEARNLPQFT